MNAVPTGVPSQVTVYFMRAKQVWVVYAHTRQRRVCAVSRRGTGRQPALAVGQALVQVVKLDALAARTAVNIERKDAFGHVRPFAKEQVPPTGGATDANRNLTERVHRRFT